MTMKARLPSLHLQKKCEFHLEEYKIIIIAMLVQPRDHYSLSYFQMLLQNEVSGYMEQRDLWDIIAKISGTSLFFCMFLFTSM